jgi:Protein of unknown function (DUF3617)
MRGAALIALLTIAACSEEPAPKADTASSANLKLEAGQWEVTSEVAKLTTHDEGPPAIKAVAGTKTTASGCIAEAEGKKPPPALLAGGKDSCSYRDFYMAGGRLNATMVCTRAGVGEIRHSVNGTYTASTIEAEADSKTYLAGPGDVTIVSKLTARRTGACPAAT